MNARSKVSATRLLLGYVAGFLAVLLFHQPALAILNAAGIAGAQLYSMKPTVPLAVPQILSLAFWGGVWGIVFAAIEPRFPRGGLYWVYAFAFGAIFPTLVAWFVVAPMKGLPMAAGWQLKRMIVGPLINGAWGVGTALLLAAAARMRRA